MSDFPRTGISVIIPAFNEEKSIALVLHDIPVNEVDEIVVVDNNSRDKTSEVAAAAGATVLKETNQGYGNACLRGMAYLKENSQPPEIVVFLDGDYSDHPEKLPELVSPILKGQADMVIGSRALGEKERGSMTFPQQFGNWLATRMIRVIHGARYTDLGPFRAIRFDALMELGMQDRTYGWTVEMQVKALKKGLRFVEVPVDYRRRIGKSKISGTLKGTVLAGYRIILTILKYM